MYAFIKLLAGLALPFYCRRIIISQPNLLQTQGPLLLACNHPNSFFDAILIGSLFQKPVHFLARGDVFRHGFAAKMLARLKAIPVYRISEGKENLSMNDDTFKRCLQILRHSGIILIFAEGICENEWKLRPLKKGAARIAIQAWEDADMRQRFRVLPVSINYSSFRGMRKTVLIHFGDAICIEPDAHQQTAQQQIYAFNRRLSHALAQGLLTSRADAVPVSHILSAAAMADDVNSLRQKQSLAAPLVTARTSGSLAVFALTLPAIVGWLLHAPWYYLMKYFASRKTRGTVFYDSVFFGLLMLSYPVYWLLLASISLRWPLALTVVLLMPVLGWCTIQWKDQAAGTG